MVNISVRGLGPPPPHTEADIWALVSCLRHLIKYTRSFRSSGDTPLAAGGRDCHAVLTENLLRHGIKYLQSLVDCVSFQLWNTHLNKCKKLDKFSWQGTSLLHCSAYDKLHEVSFCPSTYLEAVAVVINLFETQFIMWPVKTQPLSEILSVALSDYKHTKIGVSTLTSY
jgi:hypothetical protein